MSNQDLLLKQLHDLHRYIRLLGEHINQIQSRLDNLERNIREMKNTHMTSIETNKTGLKDVKKVIVTKAEVNGLFQELNKSLRGPLPALLVRKVEEPEVEEPEVEEPEGEEPEAEEAYQGEEREQEKSGEEDRRRRFPFLRRFKE